MASCSTSEDNYVFKRNNLSSIRLDYNHWIITQLSGYILHPKIPRESPGLRVADIGTGTGYILHRLPGCSGIANHGIWLIDLSRELPASALLDGFDISPEQYPPPTWLPANVKLHTQDAFKPFQQEYWGTYDIVNVRFLSTLVNSKNIRTLFENLMMLLKPNGHLQWCEPDPLRCHVRTPDPSTKSEITHKIVALMQHPRPDIKYDWIPHISSILSSLNSESVTYDRFVLKDMYRMQWCQSTLMSFEEFWARKVESAENRPEVQREAAHAVEALNEEIKRGVSIDTEWFCVVRKKRSDGKVVTESED